jgi:hypothetical protein
MRGGHSILPLDDIPPPQSEDIIDDIGEESDDNDEMQHPNQRRFPMTKPTFQKFEQNLPKGIITQQRNIELIRNSALVLFADYKQSVVPDEDVAWLCEYNHISNPPTAGSLANRKRTSSRPAAN